MENTEYITEQDRLHNLIDTSDGFLMCLFEKIFHEEHPKRDKNKLCLYEK